MNRCLSLFGLIFVFTAVCLQAQDHHIAVNEPMRGFRRQAIVLEIDARILDINSSEDASVSEVVWNEIHYRTTIPGSPVGLKLVGSNIVLALQFTPFVRRHGSVLAAQGQIFIDDPDRGMSYYTSIQTIPLEFGEPIYFYPLGATQLDSCIEIILTVNLQSAINTENEN